MRVFQPLAFVAVAAVSAVLLSACSGGGAGAGGKLSYEDSPLTKFTSALWGDFDQAEYDEQEVKIQDLIAECMKQEGFEYLPAKNGGMVTMSADDVEDRDSEKWVASNGYGMIQSEEDMKAQQEQAEAFVDPNQEYVESLSESEMSAYYETLHGPGPTEEEMAAIEEDGGYEYKWETAGCYGSAQHEVQGTGQQAYDDPKFKGLFEKMNTIYSKVAEAPKLKELNKKWASCMADAGYSDFKAKEDAMNSISDAQNAVYEKQEFDAEGMPIGDTNAAMAELKQQEIDVALADFKCSEKFDYGQESLKVQFELEKQFVEDNKAELDAMLAAYAKKK